MNFLAHIYLSGEDDELMIGNFIADSVRGKKFEEYPQRVRHGILLHRAIDSYTDSHDVVHESKDRLRPRFGKYVPVIVDVFYDHFLAVNWHKYHDEPLKQFTRRVYKTFRKNRRLLPARVSGFLPFMTANDWLANYAKLSGIERALWGLSRRSKFNPEMDKSVAVLEERYEEFAGDFERFFPDLKAFVETELARITTPPASPAP